MRETHIAAISRRQAVPHQADTLIEKQAQLGVISSAIDIVERVAGLFKDSGDETDE